MTGLAIGGIAPRWLSAASLAVGHPDVELRPFNQVEVLAPPARHLLCGARRAHDRRATRSLMIASPNEI